MIRMADVAAVAGVSITSVSHVLNGTRPVSDSLRKKVMDAVAATDYSPNMLARSLATRSTAVIGIVMSFLSNPFFAPLVASIERKARKHGYMPLLSDNHEDPDVEYNQVKLMLDHQVDGVIFAPVSDRDSRVLDMLASRKTPTVLIDRFSDSRFDDIGVSNAEPTAKLVTHLASLGHTRIGFVQGKAGLSTTSERLAGYRQGLAAARLPFDRRLVGSGRSQADAAEQAVRALMAMANRPTAIIPANDAMTVGTMRALRNARLRIPEDVAIAAFDDIMLADFFDPPLTAVAQPTTRMGEMAVDLLLKRIAGFDGPPVRAVLPAEFRHRRSCGCHLGPLSERMAYREEGGWRS